MSGRLEATIAFEKKTEEILKSLPSFMTDYYNNLKVSHEASTCLRYVEDITLYIKSQTKRAKTFKIEDITESSIVNFLNSMKYKKENEQIIEMSSSRQKRIYASLRSLCNYLIKRKRISEDPMLCVDPPAFHKTKRKESLNKEEIKKLLVFVDDVVAGDKTINTLTDYYNKKEWALQNKAIVTLLINCGMREAALAQIDMEDIDFEKKLLRVIDKRHKELVYNIEGAAFNALRDWLNARQTFGKFIKNPKAVFININGDRIEAHQVKRIVLSLSKQGLNKEITPHRLRASFCTLLYEQTRDIEFVRRAVGHESVEITRRYIADDSETRTKANQIMRDILTV